MADLNQAYAVCPAAPNAFFANNTEIDSYCACVASVEAQHLGLSMDDLRAHKGACASGFVSDRRMWRWIAAGGAAVAVLALWRRN
jgi:hypothetical protein